MQNSFYASGFLYSLKTHQILLLQPRQKNGIPPIWSMPGGEGKEGEEAYLAFQRVIYKIFNLNLNAKHIYPVYDYFHATRNKVNYVFYAEVGSTKTFNTPRGDLLSWFSFSETSKLPFNPQTKQDLVVGERVINAKWRDDEAKKTS
ncbi:hypothetical protein A3B45_04110 [Candidatus Daviesbacteria bacterium RIFCSPLOWO2_01_FULL_39_12]|uniref:Uncharacterized protein n=1 Tax=Candidatus Daviesbacteria bacterium RIFCSPLOWO2_01_FULL_39_12 TaxID=1797785 RepID=A0A1F5KS72_9BACT|nr:MAG: hypothetical protein A3D79_01060 [Candidatus Daviesbacteria bacterium RIFCSPHIGHO2_02_FULL_39_8]OGE43762.1 MAG: hypothetical protein A3B45_04110 [Candidatus Daviesbacteria bacterium RIFCSPLOWO2_01_FULL_39_12]